jgi:hypothetical protein
LVALLSPGPKGEGAATMAFGRYLGEFLRGFALFWAFYLLLAGIAFGIFSRETPAAWIFGGFALVATLLWWLLWRTRMVNWLTVPFLALSFLIAAGLFLWPVNDNIPAEAHAANTALAERHPDRLDYAEAVFFMLADRWVSPVRQYLIEPHKVFFIKDFAYFWTRPGQYVDSDVQAQMYRHLLLASGRFVENEVRLERHFCTNSPHTVVAISGPGRTVHADLWAADNFPDYEFGMYTTSPCTELSGQPRR